jgi:hypothetical protein
VTLLAGVLGMGRAQANARMTETVKVTSEVQGDPDPVTLLPSVTETVHIASSIARVKYPVTRVLDREAATQLVAAQEIEVHLPSQTVVQTDWFITVLTSSVDSSLVGRKYRVRGNGLAGQTTALRVPVEEIT